MAQLVFGLKFALIFALLFSAFEASRGTRFEEFLIHDGVLWPTASLIDAVAPAERVRVQGRLLVSSGSRLRVTRGCEGVEMLLLLTAGILAFPATAKHRVRGFLSGILIVYALTIARLMLLHFRSRAGQEWRRRRARGHGDCVRRSRRRRWPRHRTELRQSTPCRRPAALVRQWKAVPRRAPGARQGPQETIASV
jgi:exosortase/archaeosortase family protein